MPTRKHILLVLKEYRHRLFEAVQSHAKEANWNVEFGQSTIPPGWYGDGVIIDYPERNEIERLHDCRTIPIVSRIPPQNLSNYEKFNVRSVLGDVSENAIKVFDFFRSRGHQNFAGIREGKSTLDSVGAFEDVVRKNGFAFQNMIWEEHLPKGKRDNFAATIKVLRTFFRTLPKPCAMFVCSIWRIHYVYRGCEEENIEIPRDISIIANTDDPGFGENLLPSATVIAGEVELTGPAMVNLLQDMMAGKELSRSPVLIQASRIVARQSTDFFATQHPSTARAIGYIIKNFHNPMLDISRIAKSTRVSPKTLQRNFKKYLNTLPNDFIRRQRLEKTCQLLKETKMSVREISSRVGYGSNLALSLAFKKRFGVMPGEFRKSQKTTIK